MENPEPPAEDVQEILDLLMKNSAWLNMPEKRKEFWINIREHKDKEDIVEMNKWRMKYGMRPA